MPKVTAVITTYRNNNFIMALHSALHQTYKDLEIILVDGANDSHIQALTKRKGNIKYIGIKNDTGAQDARTIGCKKAKGKYIAMLDDDDEWGPLKIEEQLKEAKNHNAAMVGCFALIPPSYLYRNEPEAYMIQKASIEPTYEDLLKGFAISLTSSILIEKKVLKEVGYWRNITIGPEYDLALRVAKAGHKIRVVPKPLLIYNKDMSVKNYSGKSQTAVRITEVLTFWNQYANDFILYIGIKGFLYNVARTLMLLVILFYGYMMKKNMTNTLDNLREKIQCIGNL